MSNIVKNTTLPNILDLLAPHSCRGCGVLGKPLCDRCKNYIIEHHQNICPICRTANSDGQCPTCQNLPPAFIVGQRDKLIGQVIHDFKYNSIRNLAKPLAEILHATLPITKTTTVIIPLPTISKHIRERGFSHTKLIAKHFSKLRPNCSLENLLIRSKNTVQVGASRHDRLIQATDAYALSPKAKFNPSSTYILFDDVWTTGASMQAAIKKIQSAGAQNIIVAILALSNINQ